MKIKNILAIVLCSIMLTGCWDKVEIDKKSFVSTVGVDTSKDISRVDEIKKVDSNDPFPERRLKILNVTFGYPNISKLGPGKEGSAEEKTIVTEAYSVEDGISRAISKSSRNIHLGHMKLLILSNEIMMYPEIVKEVVDYFQRQPLINRMMLVVIAEGKAEDYVKFKPEMEENIETYILGLMENCTRNASIFPVTLNEMLISLSENGNAIVPRIKLDKEKNEVKLSGTAVIENYKIKGVLNQVETSDLELIRGKLKGGKKVIIKNGHPIDYMIEGVERKVRVKKINDDKLLFTIDIKLEGRMKEYAIDKNVFSKKTLAEIENNIDNSLSQECEKIAKMTQQKFGIDLFGLNEYIKKFKPKLWKEIKDDWKEIFSSSYIKININAKIRRIGITK